MKFNLKSIRMFSAPNALFPMIEGKKLEHAKGLKVCAYKLRLQQIFNQSSTYHALQSTLYAEHTHLVEQMFKLIQDHFEPAPRIFPLVMQCRLVYRVEGKEYAHPALGEILDLNGY